MGKCLKKHSLLKLNQQENLNDLIILKELNLLSKTFPQGKLCVEMSSLLNSIKHLQKQQ